MYKSSQEEWEDRIKRFEEDSFRLIILHIIYIATIFVIIIYYGLISNATLVVLTSVFSGWLISELHLMIMRIIDEDTRETFENFEIVMKELEKEDF